MINLYQVRASQFICGPVKLCQVLPDQFIQFNHNRINLSQVWLNQFLSGQVKLSQVSLSKFNSD